MRSKHHLILALATIVSCAALCGCAPNQTGLSPASSNEEETTATTAWSPRSDCLTCHEAQMDTLNDASCVAGFHYQNSQLQCMNCHNDETQLAIVHENVSGACKSKRLKQTEVTEATCLSCHSSYEELAAKTIDHTGATDNKGTTVNPHALPAGDGHASITCITCHEGHAPSKEASEACLSCHHAGVYECGTCHEA